MERTLAQEKRWQMHKKMLDKVGWEGNVLAEELGITPIALYMRFRRMKVKFGQEKKKYKEKIRMIRADGLRRALEKAGYDMRRLAKDLEMSECLVRNRAARLGIFKESPDYINYPARLNVDTMAKITRKLAAVEAETGIKMSTAEAIRTGLEVMTGMSNAKVFRLCMRQRGKTWRLRHRPKEK